MLDVRKRAGSTLLECMVALSILGLAGVAAVQAVRESAHAVATSRLADKEIAQASAFLDYVALWSPSELDLRLGTHVQGRWRLRIDHVSATYHVVLQDSSGRRNLIGTALYHPHSGSGPAQ